MSHVILIEWLSSFFFFFLFIARNINIHGSGVLVALFGCCMAGATWNCCRLGVSSVYTIQPCTSLQCHLQGVCVLAVTYHMHLWQNDRDFLRATAVTRVWNRYRNNSQHRKLTLEKKIFPRRSCRDSNTGPFEHESDALTTHIRNWHSATNVWNKW